jgi:hypothetical protein
MKFFVLWTALVTSGPALAGSNATALQIVDGRIVVAQSYCRICDDQRTDCALRCNGAGVCIQNCDNDYQLCREQACQSRRR